MHRLSRWWVRRRLDIARYWHTRGDLDEAARHASQALRLAARIGPVDLHVLTALAVAEIGNDGGAYAASRGLLEEAVRLLEATPSTRDQSRLLARALTCLGDSHRRAGHYAEATTLLGRALRMVEHQDPPNPTQLVVVLNAIGITAKERGAYNEATRHYATVADVYDREGASAAASATLHHNLAGLAFARKEYSRAESHARRAVALRRRARAAPVELAADVAVLAATVAAQGRDDEARHHIGRALAVSRAARPPRRYEMAVQLHLLATIDQTSGHLDDAERHYRRALSIKERLLGREHPEIAVVCNNLGTLLQERHRNRDAAECYRRALNITERANLVGHPLDTDIRENLRRLESPG
jgi:tetratricopeptide (TPR) repeat protein